jgi:mono/diheme cytochrome c family protein
MTLPRLFKSAIFAGWVLGMITALIVAVLAGMFVIFSGIYDTSAKAQHSKLVAWAIHKTMIHSVQRRANALAPLPQMASFWSGAREYEAHCMECHGGSGMDRAPWVKGMLPTPPFLVDSSAHWSRKELYNIVHDGVKMTGMPAWREVESDRQISDVVVFLQIMPKLTPKQFQQVMAGVRADRAGTAPSKR